MNQRRFVRATAGAIAMLCGFVAVPASANLPGITAGYSLLQTIRNQTQFPGLGNLMGVPLGTYNFGGTIGTQNVGPTDTIIQRMSSVTPPSIPGTAPAIPIQVSALMLETPTPVNSVAGLNNYFVTLQSDHGGPASTGQMTVTFDNTGNSGTFTSFFDVFFDLRVGAVNGPIVLSADVVLTQPSPNPWDRNAPTGAIEVPGANTTLDGADAVTPEFSTTAMLVTGLPGLLGASLLRRRRL